MFFEKTIKFINKNICTILFFVFCLALYTNWINCNFQERYRPVWLSIYIICGYILFSFKSFKFRSIFPSSSEVLLLFITILYFIPIIVDGGVLSEYTYGHIGKRALLFFATLFCLKLLLPRISIKNIEKCIFVSGFIGCIISYCFYFLYLGVVSKIPYGVDTDGLRLIGVIEKDCNLAMYNIVPFFAFCLTKKNWVNALGLCLSFGCILLSMSRGAYVAVLFSSIMSMFLYQQYKLRCKQILSFLMILIIIISFLATTPVIHYLLARLQSTTGDGGSGRTRVWRWAYECFQENYMMGIGFGNTSPYNIKYHLSVHINHNSFLDSFEEGGCVAGYLYLLMHLWLFYRILGLVNRNKINNIDTSYLFVAYTAFCFISFFLSYGSYNYVFALFLSLTDRYSVLQKSDAVDSSIACFSC